MPARRDLSARAEGRRPKSMSPTLSATTSETRSPALYAVANAALYFGPGAAWSSSVTSSTLSTAGRRRGSRTIVSRRERSGRSSVTVKKKPSAATALLMLDARRLHADLRLVQLEAAQILRRRRVGRPGDEGRERPHVPNIVVARLRCFTCDVRSAPTASRSCCSTRKLVAPVAGSSGALQHVGDGFSRRAISPCELNENAPVWLCL
jgi:hypothetical protein